MVPTGRGYRFSLHIRFPQATLAQNSKLFIGGGGGILWVASKIKTPSNSTTFHLGVFWVSSEIKTPSNFTTSKTSYNENNKTQQVFGLTWKK